jgi:hypothetical protein
VGEPFPSDVGDKGLEGDGADPLGEGAEGLMTFGDGTRIVVGGVAVGGEGAIEPSLDGGVGGPPVVGVDPSGDDGVLPLLEVGATGTPAAVGADGSGALGGEGVLLTMPEGDGTTGTPAAVGADGSGALGEELEGDGATGTPTAVGADGSGALGGEGALLTMPEGDGAPGTPTAVGANGATMKVGAVGTPFEKGGATGNGAGIPSPGRRITDGVTALGGNSTGGATGGRMVGTEAGVGTEGVVGAWGTAGAKGTDGAVGIVRSGGKDTTGALGAEGITGGILKLRLSLLKRRSKTSNSSKNKSESTRWETVE